MLADVFPTHVCCQLYLGWHPTPFNSYKAKPGNGMEAAYCGLTPRQAYNLLPFPYWAIACCV